MKHRKLLSTLLAASMTISVVGNVAPAVFADTLEDPEEIVVTDETSEEDEIEKTSEEITEETDSENIEETGVQEETAQEIAEETAESEATEETETEATEEISESEIAEETVEETVESSAIENEEIIAEAPAATEPEAAQVPEVENTEAPDAPVAETEKEVEPQLFYVETTVNGILVTVKADRGVFPVGSYIVVTPVNDATAEALVDKSRDDNVNVAYSMTFDITVYNAEGIEIEPDNSKGNVYVSFKDTRVADNNLDVDVYHITDNKAVELTSEVAEDTVVAVTDSFSYYTVEFTYNSLQYVLEGDSTVALSVILDTVGLEGEATDVTVSDESLFDAYNESGVWYVRANSAFNTDEWMKVTIAGTEYVIDVTDSAASVECVAVREGYDIRSVNPSFGTTWSTTGYISYMQVGTQNKIKLVDNGFAFDHSYGSNGVTAKLSYEIVGDNCVVVTYAVTNTNEDAVTVKIGSAADTQVDGNDSSYVNFTTNGINMKNSGTGKEFYLIPGNGDFTTRWTGNYPYHHNNVFTHGNSYSSGDSALAFSWTIIVPANGTVTKTAVFAPGANLTTYDITFNANTGSGSMGNATFVSGIPGSLPANSYTKNGFTFMGWSESANPTIESVAYADQGQITVTGNKQLYAVWLESSVVVVPPTAATGLVYDGSAKTLLATPGSCENGTMQYSIDSVTWVDTIPTKTNAGTYTVYYRGHGDGVNYGDSAVGSLSVTIAKAVPAITDENKPTGNDGQIYTGNPLSLVTAPKELPEGYEVEYSVDGGETWTSTIPTGTIAGDYTITYKYISSDNNHVSTVSGGTISVTIGKAPVPTLLSDDEKPTVIDDLEYTGDPQQLVNPPVKMPNGFDKVEYSTDGGETWTTTLPTGTDAGDYEVYVRYTDTNNNHDPNNFTSGPIIVTIDPMPAPDKETLTDNQIPKGADDQPYVENEVELIEKEAELPANYDEVRYSIDGGKTWTTEIPTTEAAGKFVINVKYVDSTGNHADLMGEDIVVNIAIPKNPTRFGYDFEGWFADEDFTTAFDPASLDGSGTVPAYPNWAEVNYTLIEGNDLTVGGADGDEAIFRAVRNRNETTTFSHHTYVELDAELLNEENYTKKSGSVIIELNPEYVAKLTPGEHTIEIFFDDSYSVKTTFVVNAATTPAELPSTGETVNYRTIAIASTLLTISTAVAIGVVITKKKEEIQ